MNILTTEILNFWFSEKIKAYWFNSTSEIDQEITQKFESVWKLAAEGKLDEWRNTADSCLALIIVLDQFPLNMFRNQAKSFSTEAKAIEMAEYAVAHKFDQQLSNEKLTFLYMPFMHSENLAHQNRSVALFAAAELETNLQFAHHHRDIIQRFGRFPHRNAILGRDSTDAEIEYLNSKQAFLG
jgi:uncharacterized protein (DUF924 family)